MKLTVIERLLALSLLPTEGDFTTIKLIRQAREALSFNEEEHKKLQFRQEGEQTLWNQIEIVKDIPLGDLVTELIKTELKKLDDEKKLTNDHFSVYEKFMS